MYRLLYEFLAGPRYFLKSGGEKQRTEAAYARQFNLEIGQTVTRHIGGEYLGREAQFAGRSRKGCPADITERLQSVDESIGVDQ